MESTVKNYYGGQVRKEWRRLVKDAYHRLEFETTLHYLAKYLPQTGLVLDAGGGPGRYTLDLAQKGYDVVLLDLTPENLAFAKRQVRRAGVQAKIKDVVEGSIVDLSRFPEATFDGVLCLGGPLSHILDVGQRDKAISELFRVAKPGAPIFISVISRLSLLIVELEMFQHEFEMPFFDGLRDTGHYEGGYGFTACHFFLPEEFRAAFQDQNVTVLEMVGLEGISSHHRRKVNQLARNPVRWQKWLETHFRTCTHPSVVGLSEHMLIVARKNS
jgi:SAM-dependent methyltransferase